MRSLPGNRKCTKFLATPGVALERPKACLSAVPVMRTATMAPGTYRRRDLRKARTSSPEATPEAKPEQTGATRGRRSARLLPAPVSGPGQPGVQRCIGVELVTPNSLRHHKSGAPQSIICRHG